MTHYVGDRRVAETALADGRGHALKQPSAKLGGRCDVLGAHDLVACGSHSRQAIPPRDQGLHIIILRRTVIWYACVPLTGGARMNTVTLDDGQES